MGVWSKFFVVFRGGGLEGFGWEVFVRVSWIMFWEIRLVRLLVRLDFVGRVLSRSFGSVVFFRLVSGIWGFLVFGGERYIKLGILMLVSFLLFRLVGFTLMEGKFGRFLVKDFFGLL